MNEIYKIYASTFFGGLAASATVISTLYFLANGVNQGQIAILLSVFMFSFALLEIPTGGIADTFGHKTSVFLGILFSALTFLIIGISNNFYLFVIAMIIAGLGTALNSGALSSLIHDILKKIGKSDEFIKVQGKMKSSFMIGALISAPFMSLIFKYNIRSPYILGFIFLLISATLILFIKWEFKGEKPSFSSYFKNMKNGIVAALNNRRIVGLVIISIGLGFGMTLFYNNINQPFQIDIGISVILIGTIAAVISASEALASAFSHRLFDKIKANFSLLLIVFTSAMLLIILGQIHSMIALIPLVFFFVVHAYRDNVVMALYQKEANDKERATMISTTSFLTYIVIAMMLPFGGMGIETFGARSMLIMLALITLMLGVIGFIIYKNSKTTI